jgi:hypothetical protein
MQPMERLSDDELRQMLVRAAQDGGTANTFFGAFQYVQELVRGNYSATLHQGIALLEKCRQLDPVTYRTIHKGTPFYWLGTAAFLMHDYQNALFYFDTAVSEDLRANAHPVNNPTPGLYFIQLDGDPAEQAARPLVQVTQERVQRALDGYNARPGAIALSLNEVRESFLREALLPEGQRLRTLATAFISFFLEWDHRRFLLELRAEKGTTEPFFLHLFKGCLLFESLVKANRRNTPPDGRTLENTLEYVHAELGIPRNLRIGSRNFPAIVAAVPLADNSIETAIKFTGMIRNTVGHNLGWDAQLDATTYDGLAARVGASCFHAIACLYR